MSRFAELVAATNYSFLRGASHPSDMVGRAIELGMAGIGIADRNSVAGVVRAWIALNEACDQAKAALEEIDFKLIVGARLVFADATPDIIAYPATRHGWGRLTRLLTLGNRRAEKGDCHLYFADLLAHAEDLLLIVMADEAHEFALRRLAEARPGAVWLGATMPRQGSDRRRLARLKRLAEPHRRSAARDQRRALRLARRPAVARYRHLHPRGRDDPVRRTAARRQCRAAFEAAGRNGAAVPRLPGSGRGKPAPPRPDRFLARPASL